MFLRLSFLKVRDRDERKSSFPHKTRAALQSYYHDKGSQIFPRPTCRVSIAG